MYELSAAAWFDPSAGWKEEHQLRAHGDWAERWYPGEVVTQAALALGNGHMPTAVDAVRVLQAAGGVSVCARLSALGDKFGLKLIKMKLEYLISNLNAFIVEVETNSTRDLRQSRLRSFLLNGMIEKV